MPGPKVTAIELSVEMCQELERLIKGHKTEQQIAKRAQIILLANAGQSDGQISRRVGVSRKTVWSWRNRWLGLRPSPETEISVQERLEDLARPGAPSRITADQRCQIEALACAAPEQSGRPINQWTGREIADELIQQHIVETISPRHAARLLKRSLNSPPHDSLLVEHRQR
jgi:putative transposase